MRYTVLSEVPNKELMECINMAFSDYAIPIHFTEDTLQKFLEASDINKSLSFCAYSANSMVGFILNSSNIYNDEQVVFDTGTGVIPEFRGKGVFSDLFSFAEQKLRKCGIKKYYLEVLQQNTRAKALYERKGFSVAREFSVMQLTGKTEAGKSPDIQDIKLTAFDFSAVSSLTLVKPSYEHSYNIIRKNAGIYDVVYLKNRGRITAFCVYCADGGRVVELGYSSLLDLKKVLIYIASACEKVTAKNIDTSYTAVMEMLISIGFKQIAEQYEMVKEIGK